MDRSDITLERMRTFVRVAERGSLSAVGRELAVGQSTVSRHLRELEEAIGVSLLSRTTRRVTLTDEGRRYYADCLQILRLVEQARSEVRGAQGAPSGTIRVSCTAAFGVLHVSRLVFDFLDRYPGIGIDLGLTDERIDLVGEGVDITLRLGPLTDSSMKLRPLGQSRRLLVAAPPYLAVRGRPHEPQDLSRHEGIRMTKWREATCSSCKARTANAMRCPSAGVSASTMGLSRKRPCRRTRYRTRASLACRRSLERGPARGGPAQLFAAIRPAKHVNCSRARGHCPSPAAD